MMNPFQAVVSVYSKYFNFRGRATRAEYWWFILIFYVALAIALVLDPGKTLAGFLFWLSLVPLLAVTVRRIQDTGRSGVWIFLTLIPVVGPLILLVRLIAPGTKGSNAYGASPIVVPEKALSLGTD